MSDALDLVRELAAGRWSMADVAGRLERLEAVARRSRRELTAIMGEAEPHRGRLAGPRLVHRRTGLRFCLVPGGEAPAFLLSEDVLVRPEAERAGFSWGSRRRVLVAGVGDDTQPLYIEDAELDGLVEPLRLPSDGEWEQAYRAGTTTLFPWGSEVPAGAPTEPHALGLLRMAWFDELTADMTIRGGGVRRLPWGPGASPRDTWQLFRSDFSRLWDGASPVVIRPALSLP